MAKPIFDAKEKAEIAEKYLAAAQNHPNRALEMKNYVSNLSVATGSNEEYIFHFMKTAAELVESNQPFPQEQAPSM